MVIVGDQRTMDRCLAQARKGWRSRLGLEEGPLNLTRAQASQLGPNHCHFLASAPIAKMNPLLPESLSADAPAGPKLIFELTGDFDRVSEPVSPSCSSR